MKFELKLQQDGSLMVRDGCLLNEPRLLFRETA